MSVKYLSFCCLIWLLCCVSCVPHRKYSEMLVQKQQFESQSSTFEKENDTLKARIKELQFSTKKDADVIAKFRLDTVRYVNRIRGLERRNTKLKELNKGVEDKLVNLSKKSKTTQDKLMSELQLLRISLGRKEEELTELSQSLEYERDRLAILNDEILQREEALSELESAIEEKENETSRLRREIKDALSGFEGKGLDIERKYGKIYLRLDASLLFASGSIDVNEEGKGTLIEIAQVLEELGGIRIAVEGHTDSDKINSNNIPKNNWELSVLRATSVVNFLSENSNLNPTHLTASGKSFYQPVDEEDKAKNRRIEIIISPDLDRLFKILNKEEDTE